MTPRLTTSHHRCAHCKSLEITQSAQKFPRRNLRANLYHTRIVTHRRNYNSPWRPENEPALARQQQSPGSLRLILPQAPHHLLRRPQLRQHQCCLATSYWTTNPDRQDERRIVRSNTYMTTRIRMITSTYFDFFAANGTPTHLPCIQERLWRQWSVSYHQKVRTNGELTLTWWDLGSLWWWSCCYWHTHGFNLQINRDKILMYRYKSVCMLI